MERKILPLEAVAARLDAVRHSGRKIVHCHGCFDLLHVGHIKHLQAARQMGDALVVTVTPDRYVNKGPGRPVFTERLRADALAALECVDLVAIVRSPTAVEAIRLFRPDYYVKGQEFEALPRWPERLRAEIDAVQEVGGHVRFTHEEIFSSTALLKQQDVDAADWRVEDARMSRAHDGGGRTVSPTTPNRAADADPDEARAFLDAFRARHSVDDVLTALATLQDLRVLVIGEAIIDEYHYCVPLGRSPGATIVTTRQVRQERHAGGALACANHIAGFCRAVDVVTDLGSEDAPERFVRARLRPNVTPHFVIRPDAPTITKRRYFAEAPPAKMFEVSLMADAPLSDALEDAMLAELDRTLPGYDGVIIADYGHGLLSPRAAALLGTRARFLAATTQANATNLGFNLITKYPRLDYACVNEAELRLATRDRWSPAGELVSPLRHLLGGAAVAVTRGHRGAITCGAEGTQWEVPAFSGEVVDPMGAGDAYLALTAPCVAAGMAMDVVGLFGGVAGALAVQIVGNRSAIEPAAVRQLVRTLLA
jgi:rfaE bifunctional protein nucleotidyltransferase chain/domain